MARSTTATCYTPSGAVDPTGTYQPCSSDEGNPLFTICCAVEGGSAGDVCAPNGLCRVEAVDGKEVWRKSGCTKGDWGERGCLGVCGVSDFLFVFEVWEGGKEKERDMDGWMDEADSSRKKILILRLHHVIGTLGTPR